MRIRRLGRAIRASLKGDRKQRVEGDKPRGTALIVAGDLITDLGDTENDRRGL